MKPFKVAVGLSSWLLRVSLVLYLLLVAIPNLSPIDLQSTLFYISTAYAVLGVTLFIGGFLSKASVTVVSGLLVFLLALVMLVLHFDGTIGVAQVRQLMVASIAFFFLCRGNG